MAIFLGKTNSGDQNFLNPLIYHRDTSLYMDLKLFGATPSGRFASILSNLPVKIQKVNPLRFCIGSNGFQKVQKL